MPSESATAAAAATSAPAPAADTVRTASPAPGSRPGTPARTPAGGQPGAQAGAAAGGAAAAALSSKVVAKASLSDLLAAAAFGTSTTSARRTELKEACAKALQSLDAMPPDSIEARRLVFHALNLACDLRLHAGVPIAVDCLGKLFAYGFWSSPKPKRDPRPAGAADQRLPVVRRRQSLVSVATSEATGLGDDIYNEDDDEIDPDDDGYAYGAEDDASGRGFSADGTAPNTSEEGGAAPSVDSAPEGGGIFGRPPAKQPLAYMAVDAICKAYAVPSLTDEATQLQIVKAITSAITSDYPASAIHGKMLLKTVRAIYNLFLSGKTVNVQTVAQASLIQITQAVFSRVPLNVDGPKLVRAHLERIGADLPAAAGEQSAESSSSVQTASQSAETEQNGDRHEPAVDEIDPTLAESLDSIAPARDSTDRATEASSTLASMGERDTLARTSLDIIGSNPSAPVVSSEDDFDLRIKDAYLVFRALCKLAMKPIPGADGVADIRSSAMRSKMLSLHLVNMVLTSFSSVFFVPAPILFSIVRYPQSMQSVGFVMAVKQYICLVFTRNITNIVPQVFEITTRIFGRILLDLRTALKKEISVMFTQVILPFMEPKPGAATATFHQRFILLQTLHAVLSAEPSASGRMIVELYLNYDCDVSATAHENIWERLVVALAKSVTAPFDPSQHSDRPMSTLLPASSTTVMTAALGVPLSSANMPSVAQANLVPFTRDQIRDLYSSSGDQTELRLRALQLLVQGILMPLIAWYNERTTAIEAAATAEQASERQPAEDAGQRLALSASGAGLTEPVLRPGVLGQDDPAAFQNLKNRKQLMLEGIKRFNQKPKKVPHQMHRACLRTTPDAVCAVLTRQCGAARV
nr:guanine nucleotide exchange protein for ADP-robosylation factor [Polyrhizophydium stewartii]